jgi:hypothetical protein
VAGFKYVQRGLGLIVEITNTYIVNIANKLEPYPLPKRPPPKGIQGVETTYLIHFKKEKQERILGMTMRTREEMVRDTLEEFSQRGW